MNPLPVLVLTALLLCSSFPLPVLILMAFWFYGSFRLRILVLMAFWLYAPFTLPILVLTAFWLFSRRNKHTPNQEPAADNPDTGSGRGFDVFINFRGLDCRDNVVDVLYNSLNRSGFRVFLDDEEIQKGEVIAGELLRAITNSRIYIPIFSKDYASSKWCLRELANMIKCWEASSGNTKKVILPIFVGVSVSKDVKLRSDVYTTALQKHKNELGEVEVKPWEDALRKVAKIKGWNLKDHGLTELADLIKKEVFSKITPREAVPSLLDRLVGMDKPVEDIMKLLEEGSTDVRFIVIHGMGGIGKTTLANAVFKKISSQFQCRCFMKDVRRSASADDMVKLQEKLLLDTLNLNFIEVSDIDEGIGMISKRLCDQNVLVVLDDVDKRDHLLNLAAESSWFGPKSRIIITTRNTEFFPTKDNKEYCFYEMNELDDRLALKLFCRHAFGKDRPPLEFHDMSTKIVATTGGLPLSLQVIGSSLYSQDDGTWNFRLEKLKAAPHKDVQRTLMVSYQALEHEQQQIFLDIACLFNDEKVMDPIYFWEACKLYPDSGIKILVRRSLIKVHDDDVLWMHDQLRDLGRAIAQPEMPGLESQFPTEPSRLWYPGCALDAVRQKKVDKGITALKLGKLNAGCRFARAEFASAVHLKFLELQGGNFEGDFKNAFQQLRWLSWFDCPQRFKATNLSFKNLAVLKLSRSQLAEHWGGWGVFKGAKHLKVMHLKDCNRLKKTPDFSAFLELKRLIIGDCLQLEEIDGSINKLKHLNYLEISNHNVLYGKDKQKVPERPYLLPGSIGGLTSLIELKIENVGLTQLHPTIGKLVSLKLLSLICPQLKILPDSIEKLTLLVELDLSKSRINVLPESFGNLKQLKTLRMKQSAIENLPDTIGRLESLEELNLSNTGITQLPETIGNLIRLKVLDVSGSKIQALPKALVKLENLERLDASFCWQMDGKLPEEIGKLSRLIILNLNYTNVGRVPTTIYQLSHLQKLILYGIHEPQELSGLPTSLTSLSVTSTSLLSHRVPDLSHMTNLVRLQLVCEISNDSCGTLSRCMQTPNMKWLARLTKLEDLMLDLPDLRSPPTELSSLSRLQSLKITCFDPQSLPHLPSSLESLSLNYAKSAMDWQLLSSLNNLFSLTLSECWLKEIKVDYLKRLHVLCLQGCESLVRLSNLSSLKELRRLAISNCRNLDDIEGLGEIKSLRSLKLCLCASVKQLPDLSRLKKLEYLELRNCQSLKRIPDVDGKARCHLTLIGCRHLPNFQGPYSERQR